ncbi:MAG: ATP synthase F1 subunit delta [Nitrospirota bacterium]|nr:ATP synthase F1 subunit delta [Nitrospirota bacterium]
MSSTIAKRYAAALYEVVANPKAAKALRGELQQMAEALEVSELRSLLDNPRVTDDQKLSVLYAVADRAGLAEAGRNLLKVLVANGRATLLGRVATAFGEMVDASEGRLSVTVTAAIELPKAAATKVDTRIKEILGADADIEHRVDASVLGGLVVQVGSRLFDHSIRHQLAQLRQAL